MLRPQRKRELYVNNRSLGTWHTPGAMPVTRLRKTPSWHPRALSRPQMQSGRLVETGARCSVQGPTRRWRGGWCSRRPESLRKHPGNPAYLENLARVSCPPRKPQDPWGRAWVDLRAQGPRGFPFCRKGPDSQGRCVPGATPGTAPGRARGSPSRCVNWGFTRALLHSGSYCLLVE